VDLPRLAEGAAARFVRSAGGTLRLRVLAIGHASTRTLEPPELASVNSGPIAVRRDAKGEMVPDRAVYRVLLSVEDGASVLRREVGEVAIEAAAESQARMLFGRVLALLRRESSM
jgi:putative peptide zinc metalloprotease protein